MKSTKSMLGWLVCMVSAALMLASSAPAAEAPAMTVGRIFYIEGDLLRYVPEEKDWVDTVKDAPFGVEDTLFSGSRGMAELIVPNGVWTRIGNSTQIQFIALDSDLAEMDVASGIARFQSKGHAAVKVTSAFGYVMADPGTIFDVYVGENSIEVVAIKGTVSFVHAATGSRYDVVSGVGSILADSQKVSWGDGVVDADWNRWNMDRENFWLARDRVNSPSAEYLPPDLRDEAYTLEENGRWERVPYEGADRWFWRPTVVAVGWSPFTVGRWTDWYGDETWIPAEPFGYVTHHYGNWIYARNYWYWAPPVVGVRVGLPLLNIGFFWNPGRVAWIHSGVYVGWVPLAPRETYYCRRYWGGPHTVVVNDRNINRITINIGSHAYVDHAIVINQNNFSGRNDYRNIRIANINRTTIINQYRPAPVVNNQVINNYTTNRQRFDFTNKPVQEKPHSTVISRIRSNEKVIQEGRKENASVLKERLKGIPEGRIDREVRVEPPRGADRIVPAKEVNRPQSELKLPQREIKGSGRGVSPSGPPVERTAPSRPAQPERPMPRTEVPPAPPASRTPPAERVVPVKPAQPERPMPRTEVSPAPSAPRTPPVERVIPAKPAQPERPTPRMEVSPAPSAPRTPPAERVMPGKPAQPERPMPRTEVSPAPSAPRTPPVERAIPVRPAQPEPQAPRTVVPPAPSAPRTPPVERAIPARPAQPEPQAPRTVVPPAPPAPRTLPAERVIPAKPAQPEQQAPRTVVPPAPPAPRAPPAERAIPARPAQPEQQAPRTVVPPAPPAPRTPPAERAIPARPAQPEQQAPRTVVPPAPPAPRTPPAERVIPAKPVPAEQARPENAAPQPEPKEKKK